jgi:hypothetical protein
MSKDRRVKVLKAIRKYVILRGECLSTEYYGSENELLWKCKSCGSQFLRSWRQVKKGRWCPCSEKKEGRRFTILAMQNLASRKRGKCTSLEYRGTQEKLWWKCENNHEFELSPSRVQSGAWCKECKKSNFQKTGHKELFEQAKKILRAKREKIIAIDISNRKIYLVKCREGHSRWVHFLSIKKGKFCPVCKERVSVAS